MKTRRFVAPSVAAALLAVSLIPTPVFATGDYDETPILPLPDFLKLDALPAKTFSGIFDETAPEEPETKLIDLEELKELKDKSSPAALVLIDKWIKRARLMAQAPVLNVLNDLHDLYTGGAKPDEVRKYLDWRLATMGSFGLPEEAGTMGSPEELDQHLAKASPALKPHYLYLKGAQLWRERKDTESQVYFEKVLKEFPKHPRAEVALYMSALTQLSRSRTSNYTQYAPEVDEKLRPRVKQLFDRYLTQYPHGRYAGDALGWLGAYYFDGKQYAEALRCYLGQLSDKEHPELSGSATFMCDLTLSHLASSPNPAAWNDVAKNRPAAQALVYLLLNSNESDNYNGKYDSVDEVRAWRRKLLPQIATAISAQEKLYDGAEWRPRYLSMLALATSGAGQQEAALKLLASAEKAEPTDDLLLARGVILTRARRPGDAVAPLRELIEKFPESPLIKGARLRLAYALADDHRAGEAILTLDPLVAKPAEGADASASASADASADDQTADEEDSGSWFESVTQVTAPIVRQLIDLWLNFAPIDELMAPTKQKDFDAVKRLRFTEAIAQRLLAKEQFEEAKKYMTPAQYGLIAEPLEKLTKAAAAAQAPAEKAAACLKLADAWAAARGKLLTYPLDTEERRNEVFESGAVVAQIGRADAAAAFGMPGNVKLDLENRDELRHAFNWWLTASDAEMGAASTATALWRALSAMPKIADVSPFTYNRAVERKWGETARKLYDRLRTECPQSPEAKNLAVFWDFPAPKKSTEPEVAHATWTRYEPDDNEFGEMALLGEDNGGDNGGKTDDPTADILRLEAPEASDNPVAMKKKVDQLRTRARAAFTDLEGSTWINLLDDLSTFLSEPDPGREIRRRYVYARFLFLRLTAIGSSPENGADFRIGDGADRDNEVEALIEKELADEKTKPVRDYFEFLQVAVTANHLTNIPFQGVDKGGEPNTYRGRDYKKLTKETEAFLAKYPKSHKREAAMMLHARAVFQASNPVIFFTHVTWPVAARWEGAGEPQFAEQEPFNAKRVLGVLDAYDKEFPKGRYTADVRNFRAAVAVRLKDWKQAVDLNVKQFDDAQTPALQRGGARRLGVLFTRLMDDDARAPLLAAIRANPRAVVLLRKFVEHNSDSSGHPLLYLRGWLREQLAAK